MSEFKVGDRVKLGNEHGNIDKILGEQIWVNWDNRSETWSDEQYWISIGLQVIKQATMSKYQELKERIENVRGWDKEADDIIKELNLTIVWTINSRDDETGHIVVYKTKGQGEIPSTREWSPNFKFYSQCEKLKAFKLALLWLLDHSLLKNEQQEEINILKKQIENIQNKIKELEKQEV